ncbi:AAA family ATPase [Oceanotoga sp. DSM 15011]|uniref:ATP-binding protein n=1 Tax=Oceanotoga sp. DSM 15011 TaxID=2984951 RepID=UPI0021F4CC07|nr:AAA family ATPase [Oceanotoga sp. DSM 15011]UYO99127.1 AAA family ATPase [Oceanotoga sp. DSM 15011]
MQIIKQPMEIQYKEEIQKLIKNEKEDKPEGWQMSPLSVKKFILGDKKLQISKKIYGNDDIVERSIVTLATDRGLLLTGVPGTAKTMLSELLTAAICNDSLNTIQGNIGTNEADLKYSWNYSLLISNGPNKKSMIKSPVLKAMEKGSIVRFEEITRSPQEVQDMLISIMSDKLIQIPELKENNTIFAKKGFNIIATANTLDKGVNEMSSALKRRFNIEHIKPLNNIKLEQEIVKNQIIKMDEKNKIDENIIEILTTIYNDLRTGITIEGDLIEKPEKNLSTAELVNVYHECMIHAKFFSNSEIDANIVFDKLINSFDENNENDIRALNYYFEKTIKLRSSTNEIYNKLYKNRAKIK